jgi:hypothetical protein
MKYLKKYFLFENLQQAENYVAKNNLDPLYFELLKDYTKEKGKLGLLYLLTIILYSSDNQMKELEKLKLYLDKIIQSNIKIDANQIKPELFYQYVDNQIKKIEANKFVDEFAPGFLKKEIKRNFLDKITNVNFQSINKEALRGKMSIFERPEDWVKYVIRLTKGTDDITSVKTSDNVEVLYEDEDWLIYYPKTYEAINYINYPQWCTIYEDKYNDYIQKGYYFIIIHNKQDKKLSYIIQVFPENDKIADEDAPKNMKNYFSVHPYNGKAVWLSWKPETPYYGWDMTNLYREGLKIFFDRFVKNNKVELLFFILR